MVVEYWYGSLLLTYEVAGPRISAILVTNGGMNESSSTAFKRELLLSILFNSYLLGGGEEVES